MTIYLGKYASAVFIAETKYTDSRFNQYRDKLRSRWKDNPKFIWKGDNIISNPDYQPPTRLSRLEERQKRWEKENKRRDWVINYLKENYPNTDYAEKYAKFNKWNIPFREITEACLNCSDHSDETHCSLERKTSCYTCCYYCYNPDPTICKPHENCKLIKEEDKNEN